MRPTINDVDRDVKVHTLHTSDLERLHVKIQTNMLLSSKAS